MPVAEKQFNEGVSQAEVEHEANNYNSNSFFGRNDSTDFYDFFLTVFLKIRF